MTTTPSTLDAVTVFREGAVCLRRARSDASARQVRIGGFPLSMETGSLRARILSGNGRVQDVRAHFDVQMVDEVELPVEAKALEIAKEAVACLEERLARIEAELTELENITPKFLEPRRGEPPRQAPVASVLALTDFVDAELDDRLGRRRALNHELMDARRELELRQRRLHEASTSRRTERARLERVVVVTLADPPSDAVELGIEYLVPGVRWVPSYQLKLERGMGSGSLLLRASIAQNTGEDWNHVALSLSTASLSRRSDVPVLKALKIGRRQAEPTRTGWRAPPEGLEGLFAGYDEAMRRAPAPSLGPPARTTPNLALQARKEVAGELRRPAPPSAGRPREEPAPAPALAPAPQAPSPRQAKPRSVSPPVSGEATRGPPLMAKGGMGLMGAVAGMASSFARRAPTSDSMEIEGEVPAPAEELEQAPEAFAPPEPHGSLDVAMQDYARLAMAGPQAPARGRLQPMGDWDSLFVLGVSVEIDVVAVILSSARQAALEVRSLGLPADSNPVASIESFDYRYDCASRVDVPSTGRWVSVAVSTCEVGLVPEYVCVPAVESKVYRTLQITNRGRHALLPGPVDVTSGDEFLMTTRLPAVPPRADATQRLGLGVEEAIKVARKTSFKESTGGLLSGSTILPHEIEVEINNRLASPAKVEVRERVPWVDPKDEKDVKIEEPLVQPPWEKIDTPLDGQGVVRGARRWVVTVPPGGVLKLCAQFAIRIPSDRMIVGGNRRV